VKRRFCSEWQFKLLLAIALSTIFCVPYFLLMYFPQRPIGTLPLTRLDRLTGFDPRWVWVYQSVYLPINVLPWLATRRDELWRFAWGFVVICAIGFAIFLMMPIACPRPAVVENPSIMYRLLMTYDGPINAFPSLHAALLVYTLLFASRVVGRAISHIGWSFLIIWSLLILYATLATKEHYAVDVLAGVALAWVGNAVAWRALPVRAAARRMQVSSGSTSQVG
jgi:membrane-associated phospholipid phosphatase